MLSFYKFYFNLIPIKSCIGTYINQVKLTNVLEKGFNKKYNIQRVVLIRLIYRLSPNDHSLYITLVELLYNHSQCFWSLFDFLSWGVKNILELCLSERSEEKTIIFGYLFDFLHIPSSSDKLLDSFCELWLLIILEKNLRYATLLYKSKNLNFPP